MCASSLSRQGRTALSRCVAFSLCPQMGDTPLHCACSNAEPSVPLLRFVYDLNKDAAHAKNNNGELPLHYICENMKVSEEIVKCVHNFNTGAANAKSNVRHSLSLSPLPAAWHDTRFTRREA